MKPFRAFAAAGALLTIAACQPLPATYTAAEAPKAITLSNATAHFGLRFLPGSARLAAADAARLRAWAASGMIAPSDRVSVAAAGPPALAAARVATISRELLRHRIVADRFAPAGLPPNRAVIDSVRYLVTLPPCPNWSKPPDGDFTNTPPSNFGCATADNLALMVASPTDLVRGRQLAPAGGAVTAAAVELYENDAVHTVPPIGSVVTLGVGATAPTISSTSP
ncbi:MAG TPA: CpaD family pilus assembly lipoprotein [Stellaceae bacterium]|nr:CpaD family pilus assembly lipoprotein [Stellaceae bacterium]